jgi:hypothetical protein
MATLKAVPVSWLFLSLLMTSEAYSQLAPWRPLRVPVSVTRKDVDSVREAIQTFTYTQSDGEVLVSAALLLPAEEATRMLKQYVSDYGQKTSNRDLQWARAIFCFGLVRTQEAREYLLTLWETGDQDLASGKVTVPLSEIRGEYNNFLAPIADALRFHLDDPNLQSWIYKRAEEISRIEQPSPVRDLNASCRRAARGQLILALYTWRIVDSASPDRDLSRLITEDYFLTHPSNIDYAKSSAAVVDIASRLKDWRPDMSEQEWMKMRGEYTDSCLDTVAWQLGAPLAVAIWEQYLGSRGDASRVRKGCELRLWWITLRSYSWTLLNQKGEPHVSSKEDQFLTEASTYFDRLPPGFWASTCIEGLYAISCYFPDSSQNAGIQAIRDLAARRLSKQSREAVTLRVRKSPVRHEPNPE